MNIISFIKTKLNTKETINEEIINPIISIKQEEQQINEQDFINDILSNIDTITPQEIINKITELSQPNRTNLLTNPMVKEKLTPYILEQYKEYKKLKKLKQKLTVVEIISLLDLQSINEFYHKCIFDYKCKSSFEKYEIFSYLCTNQKESITLVNYLLTNNEFFLEFIKNITFCREVFTYIDTELILKIILKLYSLKNDQYLYFFVSLLSIETQKELIDAYLDDNLLVNIISYLKPESIKYLFKVDKRINYLFPRIYLKDLIENGTVFPNEILNNNKFFNMLKSNSLITFRKTINDLEKNNLPEPIEFYVSKYYEELLNSYNEEYDMFNDYVYVINRLNKLNNNVNFNTYILDSDAEKVYNDLLDDKKVNIINEYIKLTSLKLSEIIIDSLFQDNIYNVWFNIREMFRFNNNIQVLTENKEDFYTTILNFDNLSNKDKIKFYNTYRNKNFYMLVRGEEKHQDVTTTKRNCYSIISNENTNIFGQGIMTTYGYNYLDVDRVLHIFEEDSYSSDLNEKPIIPCLKVNRIMTPKELSNGCSWYSEIQIVNKKLENELCRAKKPDYIVAIDYINSKGASESKRLNIPIILIKSNY